jgi:hypothetical protein
MAWALGSCMGLQVLMMKLLVRLTIDCVYRHPVGIRRMACLLSSWLKL